MGTNNLPIFCLGSRCCCPSIQQSHNANCAHILRNRRITEFQLPPNTMCSMVLSLFARNSVDKGWPYVSCAKSKKISWSTPFLLTTFHFFLIISFPLPPHPIGKVRKSRSAKSERKTTAKSVPPEQTRDPLSWRPPSSISATLSVGACLLALCSHR